MGSRFWIIGFSTSDLILLIDDESLSFVVVNMDCFSDTTLRFDNADGDVSVLPLFRLRLLTWI